MACCISGSAEVEQLSGQSAGDKNGNGGGYGLRSLRVLAYVAACLVRDHRSELDHEQIVWCAREILAAVEENADSIDMTTRVGRFATHGSRPAAAVLPLLLDVGEEEQAATSVRAAIAKGITHAVEEIRWWAIDGVRAWLWERDRSFAERCFDGLLEFALLHQRALEESRRDRTRAVPFEKRSGTLAKDLRARLVSGDAKGVTGPAVVQLTNVIEEDLLAALRLIPSRETGAKYRKIFAKVMMDLAEAEAEAARSRKRPERINYEFRSSFATAFAEFLLKQEIEGSASGLLDALAGAVERAPEIATEVLQQLIAEDRSSSGERFWSVWERCAEAAFSNSRIRGSARVVGYDERRKLLRTVLFAETLWKNGLQTWQPLERHRDFVWKTFDQVGDTLAGFAALVRLLRTIGRFLLPDALKQVDEARSRCAAGAVIEDDNARYDIELLLRDCVLSMGTQIRSREVLRNATLNLLDHLVDKGSFLAFQIRELIVAPTRPLPLPAA